MWAKLIKFANFKPEWRRASHNVADTRNPAMSLMGAAWRSAATARNRLLIGIGSSCGNKVGGARGQGAALAQG
jgi:hypothetical protein